MKNVQIKAATFDEAREHIESLEADLFREGDKAEVTYPDGSKTIFVFRERLEDEETGQYILRPDNG